MNIIKIKKLPQADYVFYLINNRNIKKSINFFFHFKKLLFKCSKNTKVLFFSSGAVYGPRKVYKKFKENEKINLNKINQFKGYKKNYAKEKMLLENEFKKISKQGFKVSIVRGFAFYGKFILKYNYLISKLINAARLKNKLIVNNQQKQNASFFSSTRLNYANRIEAMRVLVDHLYGPSLIINQELLKKTNKLKQECNTHTSWLCGIFSTRSTKTAVAVDKISLEIHRRALSTRFREETEVHLRKSLIA